MGLLKIELDLPDFKDKIEVNVVVTKDGVRAMSGTYPEPKRTENVMTQPQRIVEVTPPSPTSIPPTMMMNF